MFRGEEVQRTCRGGAKKVQKIMNVQRYSGDAEVQRSGEEEQKKCRKAPVQVQVHVQVQV